ncbi:flagellar hook-associated protein FlgL [Rhizobacter sp. Root1221]|uniref:flagellar hook-associated protein FlgL n=1 Tax=Rhizobacter sp. Root1221 TaxID=1736433 RepID=UPI0007011135|nr:flagellar hook-associated protein FlgL [Rhizobacter sp. Root1221]KQW01493.1 flagellar hook protein [Rhizobacter sp. Root1221]
MRISTANAYDLSVDVLAKRQIDLARVQEQLSTTKRVNRASDDPAAAARAERALAAEMRVDANQRAVDASANAMTLTESAMGDANDLLQQARDALVKAGNASFSDAERKGIADELAGLRKQLLAVANRTDGAGTYLFGGQGSDQPPFVDAAGGVEYRGTSGEVQAVSGETLPLTVDGENAWMRARSGNGVFETVAVTSGGTAWVDSGRVTNPALVTGSTYSIQFDVTAGVTTYSILQDGNPTAVAGAPFKPGQTIEIDGIAANITGSPATGDTFELRPSEADQSMFDVIDRAIADLNTPMRTAAQIAQSNSSNIRALDGSMSQLAASRSKVGETLNRIDSVTGRLEDSRLASQTERAAAEGLDMVKAISEFQNKQTGYDAALKSYAMVQKLSLFNYVS